MSAIGIRSRQLGSDGSVSLAPEISIERIAANCVG